MCAGQGGRGGWGGGGVHSQLSLPAHLPHLLQTCPSSLLPPSPAAPPHLLQEWLERVEVPQSLKQFVLAGEAPEEARSKLAAVGLG